MQRYRDRAEGGRVLGSLLTEYADRPDVLVLALPRGGVPVAYEVARALHAPLDVLMVRKLGVPGHEELAMGAIASGGVRVLNERVVSQLQVPQRTIDAVAAEERHELERRERLYRGDRPYPDLRGKTVLLVDDGLATGATMRAAVAAARKLHPAQVVVAVPTAASETCARLQDEADDCVCALVPEWFSSVGEWYEEFPQTSDAEVRALLQEAAISMAVA